MAFGAALVAYSIVGFATTAALLYIAATINAFGQGTLRPVLTARLTQAVGKDEQGVVLGISGSLSSVAMLLAPPTGGVMLNNGYIWGWTAIPAVVSLLGLIAVLAWAGVTEKRASTAPAAELSSGA
jgi:MFS family permease